MLGPYNQTKSIPCSSSPLCKNPKQQCSSGSVKNLCSYVMKKKREGNKIQAENLLESM